MRPVEIVGGGLGGLSLGLALRHAGVDVTVYEAGRYPRHRVCGEFIAGLPARTRTRLGLDRFLADALVHRTVAWFHRDDFVRRQLLPAPAFGVSRHTLDARLADAFAAAGGQLVTGERHSTDPAPGRVLAHGRSTARSPWLGLKLHARALSVVADLELHLGEGAYVGLSRIEAERVNVCGLFHRHRLRGHGADLLLGYLRRAGLDTLASRLATASIQPDSFCAVAGLDFGAPASPGEALPIGDARAMIAPFTGHGMALAFQSAELALDPLLAYARGTAGWEETCALLRRASRRRFSLRFAAARLIHPFLLQPSRQRGFALLNRLGLLPLRPLCAVLH